MGEDLLTLPIQTPPLPPSKRFLQRPPGTPGCLLGTSTALACRSLCPRRNLNPKTTVLACAVFYGNVRLSAFDHIGF